MNIKCAISNRLGHGIREQLSNLIAIDFEIEYLVIDKATNVSAKCQLGLEKVHD